MDFPLGKHSSSLETSITFAGAAVKQPAGPKRLGYGSDGSLSDRGPCGQVVFHQTFSRAYLRPGHERSPPSPEQKREHRVVPGDFDPCIK